MNRVMKRLEKERVVPAVRNIDVESGLKLIEVLRRGGFSSVNISQQDEAGAELLRAASERFPDLLCGGGNVHSCESAQLAIDSGADFILSPLFSADMVQICRDAFVTLFPVPDSDRTAEESALSVVSLYPVETLGGIGRVRTLYEGCGIRSFLGGGLSRETVIPYLREPGCLAATGAWMIPPEALAEGDYEVILSACRDTLSRVKEL